MHEYLTAIQEHESVWNAMQNTLPASEDTIADQHDRQPDPIPYTQIHVLVRRTLENLQDLIVTLTMVLLLVLSLQALWGLARMALVEAVPLNELLSEVLFVLILTELYQLLIFYLRERRVSVALAIEVALVSTLRTVMLKGDTNSTFRGSPVLACCC